MEYTTKTITGENFIINIHSPILTDIERRKREQEATKALEHFGKALENDKTHNQKERGSKKCT